MAGRNLTLEQREEIWHSLADDHLMGWTELGRRAGVHRTTVAREVGRNGGRRKYRAAVADARGQRLSRRGRPFRLVADGVLGERVTAELALGRSPAAIAADLRADGVATVCHEMIYRALYGGHLAVSARDCLRRRRTRRRGRQLRHANVRPGLPNISIRPAAVNERTEAGHWEADLIIGWRNRSAVLTMVERVTRFVRGRRSSRGL